ncbi:MAG TPA: hypothetical protein VK906_05820 [Egicoccus sp.]|nr:hypothetical protein [Egicoccus sp.]HSK22669.1 hypothetical protein [Egicoccus sp.]
MNRPDVVRLITLVFAGLAALFSFVAMQVAFDAREQATYAADQPDGDDSYDIWQLQDAMVRAGLIEDPNVIPDDFEELGGPWARCLTRAEAERMSLGEEQVPAPCPSIRVEASECDLPTPPDGTPEDAEMPEACEIRYRFDGRDHSISEGFRPEDIESEGVEWFVTEGTSEVDRLVRAADGTTYLHAVGRGWVQAFAG